MVSDREQLARLGAHVEASRPEPPPVPKGREVTPPLTAWLEAFGMPTAADLVRQRDEFGRTKYGQPLRTEDGRDSVEDLRQELGDALQYAAKAALNGEDMRALMGVVDALQALVFRPQGFEAWVAMRDGKP